MSGRELLLGLAAVAASVFALWVALPREGEVRHFLRSDSVQAIYTIAILGIFTWGAVYIATGLIP